MNAKQQVSGVRAGKRTGPTYRFQDGIWDVIADLMKWPSISSAAKDLGVSDTTLSRAISGECAPGEVLMARLMHVLPRSWKHEHVFELTSEPVAS